MRCFSSVVGGFVMGEWLQTSLWKASVGHLSVGCTIDLDGPCLPWLLGIFRICLIGVLSKAVQRNLQCVLWPYVTSLKPRVTVAPLVLAWVTLHVNRMTLVMILPAPSLMKQPIFLRCTGLMNLAKCENKGSGNLDMLKGALPQHPYLIIQFPWIKTSHYHVYKCVIKQGSFHIPLIPLLTVPSSYMCGLKIYLLWTLYVLFT